MIATLAHVCFTVKDLAAAEQFYCGVLGLKTAFEFRNDERGRYGVYIKVGPRSFIELFAGNPDAPSEQGSYRHLCLEVDDLAREVKRLRATGLAVSDPFLAMDHSWQAWITDPDGNRIELHQYTPGSWQTPHVS
jgi:catechol 2,3-dioxygenase-like lactoylglutathione lyase family enzyme